MDKYLTFAGSQPVYLGDIDFMQAAAANAFTGLARALMNSGSTSVNAILQGVELTYRHISGTHEYTSGVVVLNGEILPVPSGIVSASRGAALYFHIESSFSGGRPFKDGTSHQCYESRSVIISTVSEGGILVSSVERLHAEEESDDTIYNSSTRTGYIDGGGLIRKNGFWFMNVSFRYSPPEGEEPALLGSISFENLSDNHFLDFPGGISFPCLSSFLNAGEGASYGVVHLVCSTSRVAETNTVTLTFYFANSEQTPGIGGYIRQQIPIL